MSQPQIVDEPEEGGKRPVSTNVRSSKKMRILEIVVVLPAPLGPKSPKVSFS